MSRKFRSFSDLKRHQASTESGRSEQGRGRRGPTPEAPKTPEAELADIERQIEERRAYLIKVVRAVAQHERVLQSHTSETSRERQTLKVQRARLRLWKNELSRESKRL